MKVLSTILVLTLAGVSWQDDTVCSTQLCQDLSKTYQSYMKPDVSPCDDFYEYACGNFAKLHPLTDTDLRIGAFSFREDAVVHEVDAAIKAADSSKSSTVRFLSELYMECNDSSTLNSRGEAPLINAIEEVIGDWPILGRSSGKKREIGDIIADSYTKLNFFPLFQLGVQYVPALKKKMLYLLPGAGVLPTQLIQSLKQHPDIEKAYKTLIRGAAIELGAQDNAALDDQVDKIVDLEIEFGALNNPISGMFERLDTLESLNAETNDVVDWVALMNMIAQRVNATVPTFTGSDKVIVSDTSYLGDVMEVIKATPITELQNLFGWITVAGFGSFTTDKLRQLENDFQTTLTGTRKTVPHWRLCYNLANSRLPFALARIYVDSHFTAEDKKEATVLVEEIKKSFDNVMHNETWLDKPTQNLAIEKLAAIKENVGYSQWMIDDTQLDEYHAFLNNHQVYKGKFFESLLELQAGLIREQFSTMDTPINHDYLWPMTPATVNAAYFPMENSITIPAAILKSPFFDKERPIALNYGGIGVIIGHELTHGFDTTGSKFDKDGNIKNWWSQDTLTKFNSKAKCFVTQYGQLVEPQTRMHINGQLTVGENIADNGGVKESFYALHNHETKYGKSELLPGLNMTSDQLYFLGYANNWCSNTQTAVIRNLILTNPHTPDRFRVNVPLQNSPEFAATFKCKAGSKMAPTTRCVLW